MDYAPVRPKPEPMPAPDRFPPPLREIKTNEELYLAGLKVEQFHDPSLDPDPFWEEALKRDPGDARVNTALGIRRLKQARYAEAEAHFRKAIERLTAGYAVAEGRRALLLPGPGAQGPGPARRGERCLLQGHLEPGLAVGRLSATGRDRHAAAATCPPPSSSWTARSRPTP